jgi:hypothetical protein
VGGVFSDFGAAGRGQWWAEYFQIVWLRGREVCVWSFFRFCCCEGGGSGGWSIFRFGGCEGEVVGGVCSDFLSGGWTIGVLTRIPPSVGFSSS